MTAFLTFLLCTAFVACYTTWSLRKDNLQSQDGGSYTRFETENDQQYKAWIRDFNQYDLYTKSQRIYDLDDVGMMMRQLRKNIPGTGKIATIDKGATKA